MKKDKEKEMYLAVSFGMFSEALGKTSKAVQTMVDTLEDVLPRLSEQTAEQVIVQRDKLWKAYGSFIREAFAIKETIKDSFIGESAE